MAMKKMHPIFLLNLMLTVRGELLQARGTSSFQEPVQVGWQPFQKAAKTTSRTCEREGNRVAAVSEQELLGKKLVLQIFTLGTQVSLPLTTTYTPLPVLFTQKQRLCRQWGDFTEYSLPQKGALKTYSIFGFCRALFHYRIINVVTFHPVPPNCACSCVELSAFIFYITIRAKQFNHAPNKLHVCETQPGKGNFLANTEEKLKRSIDITCLQPICYSQEAIGQTVLQSLILSHRCSTICFCSFWHGAIRCSVLTP